MPRTTISARIDAETAEKVRFIIERKGLTVSAVLNTVWKNIADTGEVPLPANTAKTSELLQRMEKLQAKTPSSTYLSNLSPEGLKKELGYREDPPYPSVKSSL